LRLPAEEALTAINRTALGRLERNGGFPPALRTDRCCFRPLRAGTCRSLPLRFARLAALGFIFEILVVEEVLLSRRKNELRPAIRAFDDSILKLWHHHRSRGPTQAAFLSNLFHLATTFFPVSLTSQSLLDSLLFTRLQVKRVPFDLFDYVFLLNLALEPAKGVF